MITNYLKVKYNMFNWFVNNGNVLLLNVCYVQFWNKMITVFSKLQYLICYINPDRVIIRFKNSAHLNAVPKIDDKKNTKDKYT